jgi:cellulose synthase/poly-beta-1,6-N-acetylglucosamine synthase-like glycosyltransferase
MSAPDRTDRKVGPSLHRLVLLWFALLGTAYLAWLLPVLRQAGLVGRLLWGAKAALELLASLYLIGTALRAIAYLRLRSRERSAPAPSPVSECLPTVGLVYLCCEDVDEEALGSLCRVRYGGPLFIVVHDDSRSEAGLERVGRIVERLEERHGRPIVLLRRPARTGGKPGAVNFVLRRAGWMFRYFVLCDNDSIALDPCFVPKALARLEDPQVAAVQFHTRGVCAPGSGPLQRRLARAIDAFDVFMRSYARFGLTPFLGHNAMLRTRDVLARGGLTEGFFSDDIDLTLRLALGGSRVVYAPDIEFGEHHPPSFGAFLVRCRKWAYGCMQVLGRHLGTVLRSPALTRREKIWFLEFAGFYLAQALLIPYLVLSYVLLPCLGGTEGNGPMAGVLFGTLVLLGILAPTLALSLADRRLREWPALAWSCVLVYGGGALAGTLGVIDAFGAAAREWIPTNQIGGATPGVARLLRLQAAFGALLFVVPLLLAPDLLLAPSAYLFISVFLFSPLVALAYRTGEGEAPLRARLGWRFRVWLGPTAATAALLGVGLVVAGRVDAPGPAERDAVATHGDQLIVGGRPFQVRGIHYSPWLPGTGPMKGESWPGPSTLDADFRLLRRLHVNTLLVHDAPDELFDLADAAGLKVIHTFYIDWQGVRDDVAFGRRQAEIVARVRALKDRPSVLLWILGNEIPEWVVKRDGAALLETRLHRLHDAVRAVDGAHPVSHSNWPVTKDLDLGFLEVASFNLYPMWPREVVVRGYGPYIEEVLKPLAKGRPLLITEFGVNTIESDEARQAVVLRDCWNEIRRRTAGGVVFEFADEWWKNYDNPVKEGAWWQRVYAPDDEKTHDLDPEEYYGIVNSDRVPKPAFAAVEEMFRPAETLTLGRAALLLPLALLLGYTAYVLWRKV